MQRLMQLWYGDRAASAALVPLSWLYGLAIRLRRAAYAHGWCAVRRATRPVIVVGNLTVGGTGKTPLVVWLAERLSATGLKVGIVSRGYGRTTRGQLRVSAASAWQQVGDEPLLLHRLTGCDTVVSRDRFAAAEELIGRGADLIIADDGLQHLQLARDCEIVVIDGARGFGNGRLLPAGPLREPAARLQQAAIRVVNGIPEHASLAGAAGQGGADLLRMSLFGASACRLDEAGEPLPLAYWRGQRVHAVAGIGNPQRFFRQLHECGMEVAGHAFADHHAFSAADLDFGDALPVLMTQKDAVKCRPFALPRFWYVPVVARLSEAESRELLERVLRALGPSVNVKGR